MRELRCIDSRGIACLLQALRRSRERSTQLHFVHGPKAVERVFQIAGIDELMPFDEE